jgi:hypothetical protein
MPVVPGVIGPSGSVYTVNADAERTINWFVEQPDGGASGKNSQGQLVPRPGLTPFATLSAGPVRGIFYQDGRCFAVGGEFLHEVYASGNVSVIGSVGASQFGGSDCVSFASSGTQSNQLALTSFGQLYVLDLTTFSPTYTLTHVTSINFMQPCQTVVFFDSDFIVLRGGTRQFYYSALEDATTWDPLQVEEVSLFSDNLVQMAVSHETLWLFGSQHSLPYFDSGDADTPYVPISETVVEWGVAAQNSVAKMDNTLFLLSGNENGRDQVMRINGYNFQRVSSFSSEIFFNRAEGMDQSIGWCYSEAGHSFYHLYAPDMETSWVFDAATGVWCERSQWSPKTRRHYPHLGRCHAFAFGTHLVGDRQSGTIYRQGLDLTTDTISAGTGL